jgi:hypothetical protein
MKKLRWGLLSTARINRVLLPPLRSSARVVPGKFDQLGELKFHLGFILERQGNHTLAMQVLQEGLNLRKQAGEWQNWAVIPPDLSSERLYFDASRV